MKHLVWKKVLLVVQWTFIRYQNCFVVICSSAQYSVNKCIFVWYWDLVCELMSCCGTLCAVEHMAGTVWHDIQSWCWCLHPQLPHVCRLGHHFSCTCIDDGQSLCSLCLWLRHSRGEWVQLWNFVYCVLWSFTFPILYQICSLLGLFLILYSCVTVRVDKDDIKWLYHPWLSWQVDADRQVHWYDVICVGRIESWQRRAICSHCQLLRQHSLASVSQVWQERGKEKRGRLLSLQYNSLMMLSVTH